MKANTRSLLQEMLAAMVMRETTGARPDHYAARLQYAKAHRADLVLLSRALDAVNDALETQDKRESEEFHLSQDAMRSIWDRAKNRAIQALERVTVEEAPAPTRLDVEHVLKQRASALGTALEGFEASLKHGQLLQASARMYGYKSYQALKQAASRPGPAFCPHCGAAGSLEPVTAQEALAPGIGYRCRSCSGTFSVAAPAAVK